MQTVFSFTVTGTESVPAALTEPAPENAAALALKEMLWTFVRVVQMLLGLLELPYLIYQGVEIVANGKMP